MRKRLYLPMIFLFPVITVFMAGSGPGRSDGAPVSSTGAPDESTCALSGCHSDFPVNSGTAFSEINVEGSAGTYIPGKTYKITTRISDPGIIRFGFQLVALNS